MELRIPMQPTARPPWSAWPSWTEDGHRRRRVRVSLQDLADLQKFHDFADLRGLNWRQISRQEILYVPKNLRHRFDNAGSGGRATSGLSYPTSEGSWRPDRFPLDSGAWRIPDLQHIRLQALPAGDEVVSTRRWEGSARAWAAGALVLAVIVLIVRAVEKCLHRRFYKGRRRRQSEEWPTPNVLATSQRQGNDQDGQSTPRLEDSDIFQSEANSVSNDMPPPYAECANVAGNTGDASKYIGVEEPPPPYSACYVAYTPKDDIPPEHFYRQREYQDRSEPGHSSTETGLNEENTQPRPGNPENDSTELIFENGRVVEMSNRRPEGNQDDSDVCIININSCTVPERHLEV